MASSCTIGYEVKLVIPGLKIERSVVFTQKRSAKDFQRKHRGSTLTAVELCNGKIHRRGKRSY